MCGERDASGAVRRLPAVGAMRGGPRPSCDEEVDDDVLRRHCKREIKRTLPAPRRAPAATALPCVKNRGAKRSMKDEVAEEKGKAGRRAASKNVFRGVHQRKSGRWGAEIRDVIQGCRVWIGTYDTAEKAAAAYDDAARRIHGRNARTNFPLAAAKTIKKPVVPAAAEMVSPAGTGECAAELSPVLLAHALEATDGWEFEPYSMGLHVHSGVALLDISYADDELLLLQQGGAAADACLWNF